MNVAISTFVRRGYLLTALAVAVLLAGFSVTASAQTPTRFTLTMRASSGTLQEGASDSNSTPDRVTVTITRSDPHYSHDDGDTETPNVRRPVFNTGHIPSIKLTATCNGTVASADNNCDFSVRVKGTNSDISLGSGATATLPFARVAGTDDIEKTIELYVAAEDDDDDWNDETVVLTLELSENLEGADDKTYTATEQKRTLTIADDDPMPKLKFAPPSIQLAMGNMQPMTVGVGVGAGGRGSLPLGIRGALAGFDGVTNRDGSSDAILLSVSPPEAVGTLIEIMGPDPDAAGMVKVLEADGQGRYNIGKIGQVSGNNEISAVGTSDMNDGIELSIKAIDVSGFRDEQITFTLMEGRTEAQKKGDGGGIDDSDPSTVTILSGEVTPTVTFSRPSISIDEGTSETVHIFADTDQGDQVGSATVSVSGDALISLRQNGSAISGGIVSFGGSANAELTIVSLSDPDLENGDESTATVTITDAGGANIGDPRAVTVTVVGSTAVPVLPLFGQLVLALLLMVGGARLYRRRQG